MYYMYIHIHMCVYVYIPHKYVCLKRPRTRHKTPKEEDSLGGGVKDHGDGRDGR